MLLFILAFLVLCGQSTQAASLAMFQFKSPSLLHFEKSVHDDSDKVLIGNCCIDAMQDFLHEKDQGKAETADGLITEDEYLEEVSKGTS